MNDDIRSPAELRAMFGSNLRRLAQRYPTVSGLCRQLGINRTQFNRYLTGESFPRPDVLDRICRFFDVDARILLKPLDDITASTGHPAASTLTEFLGSGPENLSQTAFPAGFYSVTESKETGQQPSLLGLLYARRLPQCTLVRSYAPRWAMTQASPQEREVQGIAASSAGQIHILMSRRQGADSRLYMISPSQGDNDWSGKVIGLSDPVSGLGQPRHIALRHLGRDAKTIFRTARIHHKNPGLDVAHCALRQGAAT